MKKKIIALISAVVACAILIAGVSALATDGLAALPGPDAENLAIKYVESIENAEKVVDGDIDTAWKSSSKTDSFVLTFKSEQTFNTIVIREKGYNVNRFSLSYCSENGEWITFYEQDSIEDYRYCAFDDITAKQIKFEVTDSDSVFRIREFEIYNVEKKEIDNFRVSDYVVTGQLISGELFDENSNKYFSPEYCEVINQLHIISSAKWNDEGELVLSDGMTSDDLKGYIAKIRELYGENDVEIFATVFFNNCNPDIVLTEKKAVVIENTVEFLLEYGFDGVSYDWEYPSGDQWDLFNEHLVTLKNELNKYNLKLSCAVSAWGFNMSTEAINVLDQIEVMAYDVFDNNGNHSSFMSGAVQPIEYFLEKGFKPEQINLGLPFYARPTDGGGIWIDYDDARYTPTSRFQNYSDGFWFSGTQMTMDKTAYAIEKGIGGMMIFCSVEDVPYDHELSLLKALKTTIDSRIEIKEESQKGETE